MPIGYEMPHNFFVARSDDDCIIEVSISSRNKTLQRVIMDHITFDLPAEYSDYQFCAYPPVKNTSTLDRKIFVKKK
jgi:hypothetical protein